MFSFSANTKIKNIFLEDTPQSLDVTFICFWRKSHPQAPKIEISEKLKKKEPQVFTQGANKCAKFQPNLQSFLAYPKDFDRHRETKN